MNTNKKEKFINKNNAVHKRFWQIGIRTFFVFLFVIAFIGLLLPLRPKESELEKRELSKFPKPTVSTVLNGEFFSDISTWYADTFPFRETLMSANAKMKKFYGTMIRIRAEQGNVTWKKAAILKAYLIQIFSVQSGLRMSAA